MDDERWERAERCVIWVGGDTALGGGGGGGGRV